MIPSLMSQLPHCLMCPQDILQAGKNPALYGIKAGESLETQLKKRLVNAVSELAKHGLVRTVMILLWCRLCPVL